MKDVICTRADSCPLYQKFDLGSVSAKTLARRNPAHQSDVHVEQHWCNVHHHHLSPNISWEVTKGFTNPEAPVF